MLANILGAILLVILLIVVTPTATYFVVQFLDQKNAAAFHKRRPRFLMIVTFGFLGIIFIERPVYVIQHNKYFAPTPTLQWIQTVLTHVFINLTLFLTCLLTFLIHFDLNYAQFLLFKIWVIHLQPRVAESNFYSKHKSTIGNWKFLLAVTCIYWVVTTAVSFLVSVVISPGNGLADSLAYAASFFPPMIVAVYSVSQTKDVADGLNIHRQLNVVARIGAIALLIHVSISAIFILIPNEVLATFCFTLNVFAYCTAFLYALLYYPIRVYQKFFAEDAVSRSSIMNQVVVGLDAQSILLKISEKQQRFDLFMEHCVRELCHENLLFVIEITQYKTNIQNLMRDMAIESVCYDVVDLPPGVPMSYVVSEFRNSPDLAAVELHNKYFSYNSNLSIAVDLDCKLKIDEFFHVMQQKHVQTPGLSRLESVFDDALMNVVEILSGAGKRFLAHRRMSDATNSRRTSLENASSSSW